MGSPNSMAYGRPGPPQFPMSPGRGGGGYRDPRDFGFQGPGGSMTSLPGSGSARPMNAYAGGGQPGSMNNLAGAGGMYAGGGPPGSPYGMQRGRSASPMPQPMYQPANFGP